MLLGPPSYGVTSGIPLVVSITLMNKYPALWYSSGRYLLLYQLRGSSALGPVKPQCFNPPLSKTTPICPRLSQSCRFRLPAPTGSPQCRNQRPVPNLESTPFLVHLWCIHSGSCRMPEEPFRNPSSNSFAEMLWGKSCGTKCLTLCLCVLSGELVTDRRSAWQQKTPSSLEIPHSSLPPLSWRSPFGRLSQTMYFLTMCLHLVTSLWPFSYCLSLAQAPCPLVG